MTTQIVFICDKNKFSAKVQAWAGDHFGGKSHPARPYHVAWLKEGRMFDMSWRFREINPAYYAKRDLRVFDSPVDIPIEYFESLVGVRKYGAVDVALYPLMVALGLNWMGTHCMEAINDDLWFHAYRTPWTPYGTPPTPADGLYWMEAR